MQESAWRKCSSCRKPIAFDSTYWGCSVSTCNRERTGLFFCSVECWDAHVPVLRHKEAWAEERRSPKTSDAKSPRRIVAPLTGSNADVVPQEAELSAAPRDELLVVTSKVKAYVRARSGFNTSSKLMEVLSDHVRALCDEAIRSAARNERKTVLDRDLRPPD